MHIKLTNKKTLERRRTEKMESVGVTERSYKGALSYSKKEDYGKLNRVMKNLQGLKEMDSISYEMGSQSL